MAGRRRRLARLALLAVVAAAGSGLAGCGGQSDDEQIRSAVVDFSHGVADGDAALACDQLTDAAKRQIAEADAKPAECVKLLSEIRGILKQDQLRELHNVKITSVKISGDRATVVTSSDDGGPTQMRKLDGDWLIDAD